MAVAGNAMSDKGTLFECTSSTLHRCAADTWGPPLLCAPCRAPERASVTRCRVFTSRRWALSVLAGTVHTMKRAYTALTNTTDRDADLITALRWARAESDPGQRVWLWCHSKDDIPDHLEGVAHSLGVAIHPEHPRARGGGNVRRFDGPVVACGIGIDNLVEVEPYDYPVCLVHAYVPENDAIDWPLSDGLPFDRPWIDAFAPLCLSGPPVVQTDPLIEDLVIGRAMATFTATTLGGTTMYDYRDGGRVTHGLMELRRGGHLIEPERLFASALRDGWKGTQAMMFRDVARQIADGVNKRPKAHYRSDILERWLDEAVVHV